MNNETIARRLSEQASRLELDGPNVFRARAFRRAAAAVRSLARSLEDIYKEEGRAGLEALPELGTSLAYSIEELVTTGEWRTRRPADAQVEPDRLLTSLPGIGPRLAEQLEERLEITSLEQLERAARAGRLAEVGIGPKRLRGILDALAGRLKDSAVPEAIQGEPSVEDLLGLDAEYRRRGLPIWGTEWDGWKCRVQFANSALAHRLGTTRDWVVISFADAHHSGQRTVVTETRGDLCGQRVVRGRERECRGHYGPLAAKGEPAA